MIRKLSSIVLVILAACALPGLKGGRADAPIATIQEPGTITVSGEAEIRIVPDEVLLTMGIETSDPVLTTAKQANDRIVQHVLTLTERYDIPPEHVQTDYLHIEPRYRDNYTQRDFLGYFVHTTMVITLRDLDRFEDVLTALLEGGVTYMHHIEFRTTELRAHRDAARDLALQAAREKATAMAATLDQRLGEPRRIREEASQWWSGYSRWWGGARWGGGMTQNVIQELGSETLGYDGSLAPGQISITARVSVDFAMLP